MCVREREREGERGERESKVNQEKRKNLDNDLIRTFKHGVLLRVRQQGLNVKFCNEIISSQFLFVKVTLKKTELEF